MDYHFVYTYATRFLNVASYFIRKTNMTMPIIRILYIEDNETDYLLLRELLLDINNTEYAITLAKSYDQGVLEIDKHLSGDRYDVVLIDNNIGARSGINFIVEQRKRILDIPMILITGNDNIEIDKTAMHCGASDYISKNDMSAKLIERIIRFSIERKKEERLLYQALETSEKATEMAENATKLKDKFVSLVVHDIRSPMATTIGMLELFMSSGKNTFTEKQQRLMSKCVASNRALLQMVEEVLNINRLKSGKIILSKTFFDAKYLADEMIQRLDFSITEKFLTVDNHLPVKTRLYGDRALIGEVIQNLLTNAIKFSDVGDKISVVLNPNGDVAVQDQGRGIPEELIPKLFAIEEKVSTPGTAGEVGTGFGLPFSFDIMLAHLGELKVQSILGDGSTFTVCLRKVIPHVLVVDDDDIAREVLIDLLTPLDVIFTEAINGEQALSILEEMDELPHLIISAINMPRIDGIELLKKLMNRPGLCKIPVIMLTANQDEEIRTLVFNCGAKDFIVKPLEVSDAVPRIRQFVG